MTNHAKLSEVLAFSAPDEWVSMADYRQVIAVGKVPLASPATNVTVQLRKATDSQGSNAENLGSAVVAPTVSVAQAYASELGATSGGVPFTHVSAVISGPGSPPGAAGDLVIRGDGRFSP